MKYFEYEPKQIEADSSELRLDAARKPPRTLSFFFANIFDGLNVLLGLKFEAIEFAEELNDFSKAKLLKLLEKRAKYIVSFLERDELPARKKGEGWDLKCVGFRALLQVALAYILARSGDAVATKRVLRWLCNGPSAERFVVLSMLEHTGFYNLVSLSAAWEKALREGLSQTTEDIEIVAEVIEEHSLSKLVPDLVKASRELHWDQASRVLSHAIRTTTDVALRQQLADEFIPQLSCDQATIWFSEFTRSNEELENDLQNSCVQLVDHITEVAEVEELADFLSHFRGRDFLKYANSNHADAVRRVTELPNPENEPNLAMRIGRAKSDLAELIPERDICLILESSYFEKVCRQLQGDVQVSEVEQVLKAAETAIEKDSDWGPAACSVLWNDCGDSGRKFVAKNIDRFPLVAIQNLTWLIEEHSVLSLSAAFVKADLTDRTAKSLASSHKRKYDDASGPDVFWQLLDVCKRFTSYDMEDGQVPPDYASLIKDLCKGSAGILKCTSIRVSDDPDASEWNISFRCFGEKIDYTVPNSGDWFAVGETETQLTKLARKAGFKDSYIFLGGDYGQGAVVAFAPPAKLKKLAKLVAIPIEKEHPDDLEELRLEWVERLKKKLGKYG